MPITKLLYSFIENGPLTGSLFGTASYALDSVYSASLASRSNILESASSSFSTRVTNLVTDSGSFSSRAAALEIASGSFSTRVTNLVSDSGSLSTRITNLVTDSSSFSTRTATLETASGSFSTRVTNLASDSSSFSARLSSYTGSIFGTASYATKAETLVSGININAGLITASAISVTTLNVVTITSSIEYASGSNIFGTKSTDTQLFTGSVSITGSLTVNGTVTATSSYSSLAATASYFAGLSTGVANYVAKFTGANTLATSSIFESGSSVGIGTTSPGAPLTVASSTTLAAGEPSIILQGVSNTERLHIRSALGASSGQPVMLLAGARGTIASPTAVQDGDSFGFYQLGGYNGTTYRRGAAMYGKAEGAHSSTSSGTAILFQTTESGSLTLTDRMTINGAGNVGVGVTPSAWGSSFVGFQLGGSTSIWTDKTAGLRTFFGTNYYFDGTNRRYLATGAASEYLQATDGAHVWYNVASGTAGNTISFTERMRIDSSGNVSATGGASITGAVSSANAFVSTGPVTANGADRVTLDFGSATTGRVIGWGPNNATAGQLSLGVLSANATVGSTSIGLITSTGLAVTGALSATGILSGPGFRASKTTATSGLVKIQDEGANVYNVIGSRNNADSAALPLNFQATNFAFNGAVDITGGLVVGVAGTGTGITIKEYSAGTQRNWGIRDDVGVDRLRFSRGASDQVFWDVLKVAASDQTGNQFWYTNGAQRMELSSTGLAVTGLAVTGAITATGNITAYFSDDRLKTKLGKIENALDKICSLEGFYYEANDLAQSLGYKAVREVGISAQSVQSVLPEIVAPAPIDSKYLTIHYERTVPLIIEAIKELRNEIATLKK